MLPDPQKEQKIREQIANQGLQPGDVVAAKYSYTGTVAIVLGQLGQSRTAPYLVAGHGEIFRLSAGAKFGGVHYEFSSIDVATPSQRKEFLDEVQAKGVTLPFPVSESVAGVSGAPFDSGVREGRKPDESPGGVAAERLGDRWDEAKESSRSAIQSLRERMKKAREGE